MSAGTRIFFVQIFRYVSVYANQEASLFYYDDCWGFAGTKQSTQTNT